jgi:hypothetical protein
MKKKDRYYSQTIRKSLKKILLPYNMKIEIRSEADFYGASHLIAEYNSLNTPRRSYSTWSHGVHFKDLKFAEQIDWSREWRKNNLVETNRVKKFLEGFSFKNVKAVGLPIVYVPSQNVVRHKNSVLIMLAHSLTNVKVEHELNKVIKFCKALQARGRYVCFCVHADCYKQSNITMELDKNKFDWFVGGSASDVNSLKRMRNIFEYFEVVGSNAIGSHFFYAQLFGAKFFFLEPFYNYKIKEVMKDPLYDINNGRLQYTLMQSEKSNVQKKYPDYFMGYDKALCNTPMAENMCGSNCKVDPKEIASLLGWSCINQLVFFLKSFSLRVRNKLIRSLKGIVN